MSEKDANIVVYSMGRVGSISIRNSLAESGLPCFHVHYLVSKDCEPGYGDARLAVMNKTIAKDGPIKVITLIRDPFHRAISSFFRQKQAEQMAQMTGPRAVKEFNKEKRLLWTLNWFAIEFNLWAGIDLTYELAHSNFKNVGHWKLPYLVNDRFEVLVLRTESLNKNTRALSKFVGRPVKILHKNASSQRPDFAEEYARLVEAMRFSNGLVDEVYDHPLIQAAYTKSMIELQKEEWYYYG